MFDASWLTVRPFLCSIVAWIVRDGREAFPEGVREMEVVKKRIAIDMDEVVADTLGKLLECYNRDYADTVTV